MDETAPTPATGRKRDSMTIATWIIVAAVVLGFVLLKAMGQTKPEVAREWLDKGALVIDVRSEAEYQERHLAGTINIPLGRLGDEIGRYTTNKEQPLLLHCLSGTRSGMGVSTLKRLGYVKVSNLGSYGRAEKILAAQQDAKK
jgi:phage shock protein E